MPANNLLSQHVMGAAECLHAKRELKRGGWLDTGSRRQLDDQRDMV
jgi:hypothetical protein